MRTCVRRARTVTRITLPDGSAGTSVEVTQGRVRLQVADWPSAVVLSAGERSRVPHAARAPVAASAVSIDRVAPWRTGGFVALDEPLARVARALERRFDATIAIADTSVASRRVSLYYPASVSLERILSDLAIAEGRVLTTVEGTTLRGNGSGSGLTVFAPSDGAFTALGALPANPALAQILLGHVVDGRALAGSLSDNQLVRTLQGSDLRVRLNPLRVHGSGNASPVAVTATDIVARNGVIHLINSVILQ